MSTTTTTQTTSATAGQAGDATTTKSATGGDKAGGTAAAATASDAASTTTSVLGGAAAADAKKPEEQGAQGGESKDGKQANAGELEIKLPDGVKIDTAMLDGFKATAKEAGLTSESATKLASWYAKEQARAEEAGKASWKQQGQEWLKEIQADKTLGGQKFAETTRNADKALTEHGTPELRQGIIEMGLDNWPPLVRMLDRLARSGAEDTSAVTGTGSNSVADPNAALRLDYPSMFPKE